MTRLAELRIHEFRGIRELTLKLDGRSTAVIGPNGSGKSSIVDAVDFLLTGDIRRLRGEGSGGVSLPKHGPHIDAEPADAWVEGVFLSTSQQRVALRRVVANPDFVENLADAPADVTHFVGLAGRGRHYMLTRREILKFVLAEPKKRGDQVAALLELTDVDALRLEIQGAYRTAKDASTTAKAVCEAQERTALQSVSPSARDFTELLERANANRALFGGGLARLESGSVREGLRGPADGGVHPLQTRRVQDLLSQLMSWFAVTGPSVRSKSEQFLADVAEMHADVDALKSLRASDLLARGLELVEADECPLCLREWDAGDLRTLLQSRIERARETHQQRTRLEAERADLRRAVAGFGVAARTVLEALDPQPDCDVGALRSLTAAVDHASTTLLIDPVAGTLPTSTERTHALRALTDEEATACVEALLRRAAELPALEGIQQRWDELTGLERALHALEHASTDLQIAKQVEVQLEAVDRHFVAARDDVLVSVYDAIADRFSTLYGRMHREDEGTFRAALEPTRAGLKLDVTFHDRGDFPPSALHSEGHQDSMGLCLFLTLTAHIANSAIPMIVLDDVVMSVDANHRRAVAELLRDEFPETQFIITTHDRIWWQQLRSVGLAVGRNCVEIKSWNIEDGPVITVDAGEVLALARAELRADRVVQSALALRRAIEAFFPEVCDALGARVRFRADGRYSAGDFVGAAVGRYSDLFKDARRAGLSWGEDAAIWDERDSRRRSAVQDQQAETWAVNANVHVNQDYSSFTAADFEPVLAAYEALFALFTCERCSCVIRLTEQAPNPTGVRCRCMHHTWNLELNRTARVDSNPAQG
jgi:recombinational DNA repair ATPase RecF